MNFSRLHRANHKRNMNEQKWLTVGDYPTLNERLLLCRGKGWNFDPMRNLVFDWPLDRECSVYARIISGSVRLVDLGYPG